jgi:TPR repeat protein
MERHREQLVHSLVLAAALIVAVAICLLPPLLQGQTQTSPSGIDPALLAKANAGDASAQYSLGLHYDQGQGVTQDYAQAASW